MYKKKNVGVFSMGKMKITQLYFTCGNVTGSVLPSESRGGCPWGNGIAWDGIILTNHTSNEVLTYSVYSIANCLTHDSLSSRNR